MRIFKQKVMDEATKPLQPEAEQPKVEEAPKEPEQPKVEKPKKEKVQVEEAEDRSAFNCPTCKGEGIVIGGFNKHEKCPDCLGTGKVN